MARSLCSADTPRLAARVVVPTAMSRPEQLRSCVRRLDELDHPDYEVIVVDNRPAGAPPVDLPGRRRRPRDAPRHLSGA